MIPPDGSRVIIFDPHVATAIWAIFLALGLVCVVMFRDFVKRKIDKR